LFKQVTAAAAAAVVFLSAAPAMAEVEPVAETLPSGTWTRPTVKLDQPQAQRRINDDISNFVHVFRVENPEPGSAQISYKQGIEDKDIVSFVFLEERDGEVRATGRTYDKVTGTKIPLNQMLQLQSEDLAVLAQKPRFAVKHDAQPIDGADQSQTPLSEPMNYYVLPDGSLALLYDAGAIAPVSAGPAYICLTPVEAAEFNQKNYSTEMSSILGSPAKKNGSLDFDKSSKSLQVIVSGF